MAIMAIYVEGHEEHGETIDFSRSLWTGSKTYRNENFAFIVFDIADDHAPGKIITLGGMTSMTFDTIDGQVECDRVYLNATIETLPIKGEDNG